MLLLAVLVVMMSGVVWVTDVGPGPEVVTTVVSKGDESGWMTVLASLAVTGLVN